MEELYFATSGIRGKANTVISPELGLRVGRAVANWLKNRDLSNLSVYVGFDNRRNSHTIASTITAGLSSSGVNARKFNKAVPTPLVIFATSNSDAKAGVMVTGSHLPKDENGIILFDQSGNYYKGILPDTNKDPVAWEDLGRITNVVKDIEDYKEFLIDLAKSKGLEPRNWDILVDPVHGPMKDYLELILRPYTHNLIQFNWEDDDSFSGRISEPSPSNLAQTSKAVTISNCDLGIATDMDGDRVIFLTNSGDVLSGDYIGAILAQSFWEKYPKLPVVAPINTSAILNIVAKKCGGEIHYCKVGPPSIIQAIRETGAKYGFEETGKYIFSDYAIWPDAAISTIMLLSYLQSTDKKLNEIINELPKLDSLKTKVPANRDHGDTIMEQVRNRIIDVFDDIDDINDMDGLRVNFGDHSWILIRPSGTEDCIRVFSEHPNPEKNEKLNKKGRQLVKQIISELFADEDLHSDK